MNLRRRLPILAAAVMLVLAVGCTGKDPPPATLLNEEHWLGIVEAVRDLKAEFPAAGGFSGIIIGFADDISGSAGGTGIQRVTLDDLKPAIERIQHTGGEIALATISDRGEESLIRLPVLPPPILPPNLQNFDETPPTENTFKCLNVLKSVDYVDKNLCAQKMTEETTKTNRSEAERVEALLKKVPSDVAKFRAERKEWEDKTKKAIDVFNLAAQKLLTRPIGGNTDRCRPFNRLALFVKEPSDWLSKGAVIRAVILSTDGEETVRPGCQLDPLPDGTDLYLINCAKPCALDPFKPQKYEAFTAALNAVIRKQVSTR